MADPVIVQVSIPPILVPFAGGNVTVPTWPMPLNPTERRTQELGEDQGGLVLGPKPGWSWKARFFGFLILTPGILGLGLTTYTILADMQGMARVGGLLFASVVVAFFALLLISAFSTGLWVRFDPSSRQVTWSRRPFGIRRAPRVFQTIAFDEIACVQLIFNGYHQVDREFGSEEQKSVITSRFYAYQMNLVLGRETSPRVNLAHHPDWQWIRPAGGRIASVLGVPVVDQLYHGG